MRVLEEDIPRWTMCSRWGKYLRKRATRLVFDFFKAFDLIERKAIIKTLREQAVQEGIVKILFSTYGKSKAYMEVNREALEFPAQKG